MRTSTNNIERSPKWLKGSVRIWLLYVIVCAYGLFQLGCSYARLESATINNRLPHKGESLPIEVIRGGEKMTPKLNMDLQKGDEIKTPPGVTAFIKFGDGSEITMMPETNITIESISLWFGKLIANIKGRFKVKTEYVTAVSEGTVFLMSVDRNNQSIVTMIEGGVILTSNENRWPAVSLQSGQEARIWSADRPTRELISPERYNDIIRSINDLQRVLRGTVLVPRITGLQEAVAQEILVSAGLRVENISKTIEGDSPIGTVVRQQPERGKSVRLGSSVAVWVSAEAKKVPYVVGRPLNQARDIIQRAGLSVHRNIKERITGEYNEGEVNAQSPSAGQRLVEGTAVRLTVEERYVKVPDVTRTSIAEAEARIRERGLGVTLRTVRLDPQIRTSQVERQEPAGGTPVKPGTTVWLYIAAAGVQVPNLMGQSERVARSLLAEVGLRTGFVSSRSSPQYRAGVVIDQSPRGDQVVEHNSEVNLTVSTGSPLPPPRPNLTITRFTFDRRTSVVTYSLKAEGRLPQNFNMAIQVQYGRRSQWLAKWRLSQNLFDPLNKGLTITGTQKIDKPYWGDGEYIISIFADIDNQIRETNEQDNRSDTKIRTIG